MMVKKKKKKKKKERDRAVSSVRLFLPTATFWSSFNIFF